MKLIAFDLDGTLLRDDKTLSERNKRALIRAAEKGIYLVPSTGRLYRGVPEEIRALPFIRYYISANGAAIYDAKEQRVLHQAELSREQAEQVFHYAEHLPVICACYQNNRGWMDAEDYKRLEEYVLVKPMLPNARMVHTPLENMKERIFDFGSTVQKINYLFRDVTGKAEAMRDMQDRFPELAITTSLFNIIEINVAEANKGQGLKKLCRHLGIDPSECLAFGDGINDLSLIREAGIGAAMENAAPELLEIADRVARTNEQDGVAEIIEEIIEEL